MSSDPDLLWITGGATLVFAAAAIYAGSLTAFLGRTRRLKAPPRFAVIIFRVWFSLLAAGALWLLVAGRHGLLGRAGTP